MLKDFDVVKKQLAELADAVNKFKSEAVQLRLVELLFSGAGASTMGEKPTQVSEPPATKTRRKTRKKSASKTASTPSLGEKPAKKPVASGDGAVATLVRLHEGDFFKTPRSINDILMHCETNLARRIKGNEISGKLARMVRSGDLKRQKNTDSQYEYTKP